MTANAPRKATPRAKRPAAPNKQPGGTMRQVDPGKDEKRKTAFSGGFGTESWGGTMQRAEVPVTKSAELIAQREAARRNPKK